MRLIMLSPPGAGKGTHSKQLSLATGIAHISSGDLLRAEIDRGTELGLRLSEYTARGDLVPDDLIFDILTPVVVEASRDTGGYVLDGFPRTMPQALRAAQIGIEFDLVSDAAVYLTAPDEVLIERLRDRAQREGRADDTPEVIRHRLAVFAAETQPLVDYYRRRGILIELDTDRPQADVQADLRAQLAARGVPESRARSDSSRSLSTSPAGHPLEES
jgi:adenylate kinase